MKLLPISNIPQPLLAQRLEGQRLVDEANKKIERLILEHAGISVGDEVVDEDKNNKK